MVTGNLVVGLGVLPVGGRGFQRGEDRIGAAPVVVLSYRFWQQHFGGAPSAIGKRIVADGVSREIVGVIRQVKVDGLSEKENAVEIYVPISQNAWFSAVIAVRTAIDPLVLAPAVKAAVARVDKDQPVTRVRTMDVVAAESIAQPRFRAQLVGAFAVLALALDAEGIFCWLAFSVRQRRLEFGSCRASASGASE